MNSTWLTNSKSGVRVIQVTRSDLFPSMFPAELRAQSLSVGDEVAWVPVSAVKAVEWLGMHGYAVLGTELWLLQGDRIQSLPSKPSGLPEVHCNTVKRRNTESWSSFAARAMEETRCYLQSFRSSDILEQGQVYFNVVWISEADFQALGKLL